MEPEKLLTSPDLDLTSDNLKNGLGRWFSLYDTLTETLSKPPYDISPEWRFYKDGGAWLCKKTRKKTGTKRTWGSALQMSAFRG